MTAAFHYCANEISGYLIFWFQIFWKHIRYRHKRTNTFLSVLQPLYYPLSLLILNTTDYVSRFAYISQTLLAKKSRNAETHLSKFLTKHCQHRSILPYQLRIKISIAQQILLRRQCLAFAIINSMAFGSGQSGLKYAFYMKFDQLSTRNSTRRNNTRHNVWLRNTRWSIHFAMIYAIITDHSLGLFYVSRAHWLVVVYEIVRRIT